jgi:hypothetical protein
LEAVFVEQYLREDAERRGARCRRDDAVAESPQEEMENTIMTIDDTR